MWSYLWSLQWFELSVFILNFTYFSLHLMALIVFCKRFFKFFDCMCMCVFVCVSMCSRVQVPTEDRRRCQILELGLHSVRSYQMWMLGPELRSWAVVFTLNHRGINNVRDSYRQNKNKEKVVIWSLCPLNKIILTDEIKRSNIIISVIGR